MVSKNLFHGRNKFKVVLIEVNMMKLMAFLLVLMLASCASLEPGAEKVKLVSDSQQERLEKNNCTQLGPVDSGAQDFHDQAFIIVRNEALKLGANVVLTRGEKTSHIAIGNSIYTGNRLKGVSFKCPESLYNKLIDISKL